MTTAKGKRLVGGCFWAEVVQNDTKPCGFTGEIVFCEAAEIVDYGWNKLAGPFRNPASLERRLKQFRVPTRVRGLRPYRSDTETPDDFNSVACCCVDANDVRDVTTTLIS